MYWEPPSVQPLTNQHMSYAIGELATVSCAVSGIPLPKMSWQHNDQPIKNNQYYEISEDGLSLSIHGFNAATEGTYTCMAQSILNSTSRSDFHLILGTPPIASTSPNDLAIALGKEDWLHCNAETPVDFPRMEAKISWRRQHDIPIDLMRHEVLASGTLHIIDFQEQDEGIYICTMENDFGKIDLKAKLEVSINSANSRHVISATTLALNLLIFILGTIML
ncbi:contactin-5-like isoform X2 [Ischnura elegans]|nr:contactin-5-like isoform X2 [Ischnura elegans]